MLATFFILVGCLACSSTLKMETAYVLPKCRLTFNRLYDIIAQTIKLFIISSERTSDPTSQIFDHLKLYIYRNVPSRGYLELKVVSFKGRIMLLLSHKGSIHSLFIVMRTTHFWIDFNFFVGIASECSRWSSSCCHCHSWSSPTTGNV